MALSPHVASERMTVHGLLALSLPGARAALYLPTEQWDLGRDFVHCGSLASVFSTNISLSLSRRVTRRPGGRSMVPRTGNVALRTLGAAWRPTGGTGPFRSFSPPVSWGTADRDGGPIESSHHSHGGVMGVDTGLGLQSQMGSSFRFLPQSSVSFDKLEMAIRR